MEITVLITNAKSMYTIPVLLFTFLVNLKKNILTVIFQKVFEIVV